MADPQWMWFGSLLVIGTIGLVWFARLTERFVMQSVGLQSSENQTSIAVSPREVFGQSRPLLYTNIIVSHTFVGLVVLGIAWLTHVPLTTFGSFDVTAMTVFIGISLGLGLAIANQGAKRFLTTTGLSYSELLRFLLSPSNGWEWAYLSVVVLPVIAIAEELVFRAALIGAVGSGSGVSPWVLVVGSSVLFGLGHSLQGRGGILVTGILGFTLGAAFVFTGNLVVVITAHYVVNFVEFTTAISSKP